MRDSTIFVCGPPKDHKCDYNGQKICGGYDTDGNPWQEIATEETCKKATWGSVSCSICGETDAWRDLT